MAEKILTAALLRWSGLNGFEKKVWKLLGEKKNPWGFIPQFPLHGYILDFYSSIYNVALEIDGPVHVNRRKADRRREKVLLNHGIKTLHITPADLRLGGSVKTLEYIQNFMLSSDATE
jgi:very-short-patch-repair endonuclease